MYHQYSSPPVVRGVGAVGNRRGKRAASSGQTIVYPLCSIEQRSIECVLYIYDSASRILAGVAAPLAPVVNVSCAETLRGVLDGNGFGVFEPDAKCRHLLTNEKAHLSGFCIDLYVRRPLIHHHS
jgi:hypothetical protein